MKKRPLTIWLIALCLILSPAYYYFEKAVLAHLPWTDVRAIFGSMSALKLVGVVLGPVVGALVLRVRESSWYAIIAFAIYTMAVNTSLLLQGRMKLWIFLLNAPTAIAVLLYFVRREVVAPYFNPRLRWWESDRVRLKTKVEIDRPDATAVSAESFDISPTGVFLVTDESLPVGSEFSIRIAIGEESITTRAAVVWESDGRHRPRGVGVRFDAPSSRVIKAALHNVVPRAERRHAFKLEVDIAGRVSESCRTFDISATGCFLSTESAFSVGEMLAMTLHLADGPVSVDGCVVWVSDGSGRAPRGIGVRFSKASSEIREQLERMAPHAGSPAKSVPPPPAAP